MRVLIELSYDGASYHGWQRQPNGFTVQEELETKLSVFTGTAVSIMGCGRTDAGVHASYFVAHADWPMDSSKSKLFSDWKEAAWKINGMLPPAVAVHRISEVDSKFHARFDAIERGYIYRMHTYKDPFLVGRSARIMRDTDFTKMNEAAKYLIREGDFAAFCKTGSDQKTTQCNVTFAEFRCNDAGDQWEFEIRANRFLRNMVRAIVGTLLDVGQGRTSLDEWIAIIQDGTRSDAGASAPAEGLYLNRVVYPGFESLQSKSFMKI
ncbi:MAG: tRNA pseudouridine(38-40) synthase TruA [Bacteroidetes bacterium]|nr:tRNA pseudouridine(38-40) synthase TruA [Bacteroidota bacterium]MDA1336782.1 tRNA pseudouridine(38-40) synthase TruA [Bacteroidota bacterium]